ncbi:DHH family phosphoesterase [Bacillus sp. FJAT-22090]|uniref:DHH family phosphoesterase n=1 Tax=Bacillus sp. FJAT-22090 TaxID=1581038 RepID=UPI00119FC539|nr:DHH family phosphoesterase [Bacillus sp. FJAT-22090]
MYKLINKENVNVFKPIKTIFSNRNISPEDIEWFIKPTKYEYSPLQLGDIEKAIELLLKHVNKGWHIHVQIDKDLDGFTSSAILINYLKRVFPNISISWSNHTPKKKHGIDVDLIPDDTALFIVPDAGSNEYEIHQALHEKGIDLLILDHHEAPQYSEHAVTVNNQLDEYPNKWLSGAGIVFKFIQVLDKKLGLNYADDYLDLVAFGMVGDAMQLSSKETKWLITKGLSNVKNEFLHEIIKENVDDGVELTPSVLSFKCNPKINAYLRMASTEELDELFMALLGHQEVTINPKLRKADKSESWARRITRICNNMYAKQRRIKEKLIPELSEKIENEKLYENTFMILEIEGDFEMNMSGYIASFLVGKYKKPTLILRKNEDDHKQLVGSMRGYDRLMENTKDFLQGLQLFEAVEGHQGASGLKIDIKNFTLLDESINEALKDVEVDENYLVDLILPGKSLTSSFVNDIERYSHIWGKGIEPPTFAVEKLEINLGDSTLMGKEQTMIKFSHSGVSYAMFNDAEELIQLRSKNKTAILNVVGRTGINSYRGNTEPQFIIEAFEVVEVKDTARFVF